MVLFQTLTGAVAGLEAFSQTFLVQLGGGLEMAGSMAALSCQFSNGSLLDGLQLIETASNSIYDDPELAAMQNELKATSFPEHF